MPGRFGSNVVLKKAIGKTVDVTVNELRARFDILFGANENEQAKQAQDFHHDTRPIH